MRTSWIEEMLEHLQYICIYIYICIYVYVLYIYIYR